MGQRMSELEALLWTLEKDPYLGSTFANLTLLDRVPDLERFRRRMAHAAIVVPRLRQRVGPGIGRLVPPEWRDDRDLDLDHHVRAIALPAPGTRRQLLDLVVQLAGEPLDRARPLWRFTVIEGAGVGAPAQGHGLDGIEGLPTGTVAAMVQQLHHSLSDGEGGVRMSAAFLDLERDAPEPAPVEPAVADRPGADAPLPLLAGAGSHLARRGIGIVGRVVGGAATLARRPDQLAAAGEGAATAVSSLIRQGVVRDPARSPLWTQRTLRRRLELLRIPLEDTLRAAKALGGTVNDVFVTGAAGGAGRYHAARGHAIDELRMAMPVSTRTDRNAAGNAFTPARLLVPCAITDPAERFAAVRARLATTKGERAIGLAAGIAGVANLAPTTVLVRAARAQAATVDFTTSNLRGAPFPLYVAGARMTANHPLGPLAGTAWNLTTISVDGSLDMGLNVDAGAVEDPEALRGDLEAAFAELLALG
jgi:WS/DGAT/MGAT family acyltransferase